ncbi:uncharacterized protein A4U43_C03F2860 [Asparagus officinalis]|uniref:Serine/threonine-protein phosphatase 2A activator n=1 Tax=Asparagus officinalis TaxID=4686 RepID=A0A5P1FBB1_ASPOF|nr:uncharacterized protein A4U43_C03F2860 [Asparagus officinalis]
MGRVGTWPWGLGFVWDLLMMCGPIIVLNFVTVFRIGVGPSIPPRKRSLPILFPFVPLSDSPKKDVLILESRHRLLRRRRRHQLSSCEAHTVNTRLTSPPSLPRVRPIRYPAVNAQPNLLHHPLSGPTTLSVPPSPSSFSCAPTKQISSPTTVARLPFLRRWTPLPRLRRRLSSSVAASRSRLLPLGPTVTSLLSLLETLIPIADEIPPLPHSARYGNPAFRLWHEKLESSAGSLLLPLLQQNQELVDAGAVIELVPYLLDSFGNPSRIDYGTGHETNFAAFLFCLARLDLIKEQDYPAIVLRVFVKYVDLMRKLQLQYCLEPAGSHGVWGLDDYHFLPFIFGSAQLIDHKYMKPKSIHNEDVLENFEKEYMYLAAVAFVKKVKKGVFAEHSPMLDDISGVPNWAKVNSGLLKMYKAEVLEKVPIMQHFLFGSIIKWE